MRDAQDAVIIHLGDHDPSGLDMSRDIAERLSLFAENTVEFKRIALNMDQVDEYQPPENPAKLTDSRGSKYIDLYGDSSWELDALPPQVLVQLIQDAITPWRDDDIYDEVQERQADLQDLIRRATRTWPETIARLRTEA